MTQKHLKKKKKKQLKVFMQQEINIKRHWNSRNLQNYHNVVNGRDRSLLKIKPLSQLIGAFKTTSSKLIHISGLNYFQWQKSFYDHIIKEENELQNIREYIKNNPLKWELDRNNPKNINADGTNVTRLTNNPATDAYPSWSR